MRVVNIKTAAGRLAAHCGGKVLKPANRGEVNAINIACTFYCFPGFRKHGQNVLGAAGVFQPLDEDKRGKAQIFVTIVNSAEPKQNLGLPGEIKERPSVFYSEKKLGCFSLENWGQVLVVQPAAWLPAGRQVGFFS